MAVEARYVGNQNLNTWAEEDWNERSVFSSGFFEEFKLAQRNIAANIAAGQGTAASPTRARRARRRCRSTWRTCSGNANADQPGVVHLDATSPTRRSSTASARCARR